MKCRSCGKVPSCGCEIKNGLCSTCRGKGIKKTKK